MANIKSQIKRNRQNEKRRLRNRNYRGAARTAVTQARAAFEAGAPETKETVMRAISMLDKAAERGVIHPNNAARRKGRLMKRLVALGGQPVEKKMEEPRKKVEAAVAEEAAAEARKKAPERKAAVKEPAEKKPAIKKTAEKKPAATSAPKGKKTAAKK